MDSGVAALCGALVGGGITAVISYIQARSAERQNRIKIAADLGLAEWNVMHELGREHAADGKKVSVMPLFSCIAHQALMLELIEKGELTPEAVEQATKDVNRLLPVLRSLEDEV